MDEAAGVGISSPTIVYREGARAGEGKKKSQVYLEELCQSGVVGGVCVVVGTTYPMKTIFLSKQKCAGMVT